MPRSNSPAAEADRAARERAAHLLGTVLSGRYRLLDLIALGGVGAVYLGEHLLLRKQVAIKVLHPDTQLMPDLMARFHREAVAGAHIQHPNIATATDFGETESGLRFLVLEYVSGETLRAVIDRGPLPVARAVSIAKQIAAGLGAAHRKGILHRDIKPRNIMVSEGPPEVVKLIDFGLAKVDMDNVSEVAISRSSIEDAITDVGAIFGTIAYLAPEAASGMEFVDARADLYSLGVVLYEMLAGRTLFETKSPMEVFQFHRTAKPAPIAARAPGVVVPPAIEAVVRRLLEKDPAARYPSSDALVEALDRALAEGDVAHAETDPRVASAIAEAVPSAEAPSPAPPHAVSVAPHAVMGATPTNSSQSSLVGGASLAAPQPSGLRRWAPHVTAVVLAATLIAVVASRVAFSTDRQASTVPAAESLPSSGAAAVAPGATASAEIRGALLDAAPIADAGIAPTPAGSTPPPTRAAMDEGALAARLTLRSAVAQRDWAHALPAFFKLVSSSPASFRELQVTSDARDLATAVAMAGTDDADRMFNALTTELGADGLDVLYEIVRARGGTKAAARAEGLLRQPEVIAAATPAMRVSFEFRIVPCEEKAKLLDRAVAEGDRRTLMSLETAGSSCFSKSPALRQAIRALQAKLNP